MKYGTKKSDLCSDRERDEFLSRVKALIKPIAPLPRMRAFASYGGMVRIYTGKKYKVMPLRARRRLVAFKNPDGVITGTNKDAMEKLRSGGGTYLYERHYEPIEKTEYADFYRTEDWEMERKAIMEFLGQKGGDE